MKKIILLSVSILFHGIVFSQSASTTVNMGSGIMPDPKLLLGITYDCRSSMADKANTLMGYHNKNGTFNPSVDSVFGNFPMSTLRYPANGIMQGFEWKKSVGPVANRIPQQIFAQTSVPAQILEFGFDEFMAMTAARGVDPKDVQIMAPIYDSADTSLTLTQAAAAIPDVIRSNADWVEYCNAPNNGSNPGGGVDWAAVRAANGHSAPYGIKLWNLGNEPYTGNEFTGSGASNYIKLVIPMIDSMLAIDSTIKITLTVQSNVASAWTSAILKTTAFQGKIYGINCHFFLTEEVQQGFPSGGQPNVTNGISRLTALASAAQAKGYKVIVGDQAHAIISSGTPTQAQMDIAMQWQGANETADFLMAVSQIDNIERSNFWVYGLWTNAWHPIRKNANGTFTSMPVAELYKILNPLLLDYSVAVSTSSPTSSDSIPYSIRSSAFISSDSAKLNVISVNRDKMNTIPLEIKGISGYQLSHARIFSATALNSDTIVEAGIKANSKGEYSMPPMGILILEYEKIVTGISYQEGSNNKILFYPNPFSTHTILRTSTALKNATLTVNNCVGQTVRQINNLNGETVTLTRDGLPGGLYFVRVMQGNQLIGIKKIMVVD